MSTVTTFFGQMVDRKDVIELIIDVPFGDTKFLKMGMFSVDLGQ